jgi:hypothetical protein
MGTGAIPQRTDGPTQTVTQDWFAAIRDALIADLVGRAAGTAGDKAGAIGTAAYRWKQLFSKFLVLGGPTYFVTVKAPAGLSAPYTITLPSAIPTAGLTALLTMAADGTLSAADRIAAASIASQAITIGKLATMPSAQVASAGQLAKSPVCTSFLIGTSFADITNLDVTLTTTGRPVNIMLLGDDATPTNKSRLEGAASSVQSFEWKVTRDAAAISYFRGHMTAPPGYSPRHAIGGLVDHIDYDLPAGTYQYKLQVKRNSATYAATLYSARLVALEI